MFFQRIYDERLAQASYLIGCQATGEALVIDPNRDVEQYVAAAAAERLRITHVTETHIHADFVSGTRALAARTGARMYLSAEGGSDWQYAFAATDNAVLLRDGESMTVGRLRVDVLHTPGHTPEHLMFVLTDLPASEHPLMAFTGDFVFVGDVGRPDLLEKAAGRANTMEAGARELWRSLGKFRALPDHVQVWPGHGAGSACGKALGAVPASTVGYEKLVNWGVSSADEATFVRGVLEGQPDPPAYFARMKRVNRDGPPPLAPTAATALLDSGAARSTIAAGAVPIDVRKADAFARGHLDRSLSVPLNRSFTKYAGSIVPYDVPIVLVVADGGTTTAADAGRALLLIGLENVIGHVTAGTLTDVGPVATLDRLGSAEAIARHAEGALIIDVRDGFEWDAGHVPGARHIPMSRIAERAGEIPSDEPALVYCQTGSRSAIAASALRRLGIRAVDAGGIVGWEKSGGPVEAGNGR